MSREQFEFQIDLFQFVYFLLTLKLMLIGNRTVKASESIPPYRVCQGKKKITMMLQKK